MRALPAILVAVIAYVTLDRGLDRAFSEVTNKAIQNSYQVAEAYAHEHARQINGDILAMAGNISRARLLYDQDRQTFRLFLRQEAISRNLSVAMLLDPSANVIETASTGIFETVTGPSADFLEGATETTPQLIVILENHYVAAVVKLSAFDNTFLYVVRTLEPIVVAQLNETKAQVAAYDQAKSAAQPNSVSLRGNVRSHEPLPAGVCGADRTEFLQSPRRTCASLDGGGARVATGDLQVQVPIIRSEGDLAQMGEIFNKMTRELRTQRDDLMQASELIDSRRRFTEAVLSAASAGIIGVDGDGRIGILNRSAEKLIGHPEAEALGHTLSEIVPELDELIAKARQGYQRLVQGQATISRDGKERNLSVRVSAEQTGQAKESYIITLDDITELVSAQRTSAWADVARRIAHEIKNPLTPIQLPAERLRRKYGSSDR